MENKNFEKTTQDNKKGERIVLFILIILAGGAAIIGGLSGNKAILTICSGLVCGLTARVQAIVPKNEKQNNRK